MNIAFIFIFASFILTLLGVVAILNFYRFRFKGDKTVLLIILFTLFFFASIVFTLAMFQIPSVTQPIIDQFAF